MSKLKARRLRFKLQLGMLMLMSIVYGSCSLNFELCTPQMAEFGFFSRGDCALTNASFFQGHEWLTYLANQDLPPAQRYSDAEARAMAEGNRRVDYPKELLIHLNNGILAYVEALVEFTDRPEVQRQHFLLNDRNSYEEAASAGHEHIISLSVNAIKSWNVDRDRALALIGQAHHTIQDSFSPAHTVREPAFDGQPWAELDEEKRLSAMRCVRKIKAFAPRASGFGDEDIEYHGATGGENLAHTTPEDSIYREGDDCHSPTTQQVVEDCLSMAAQRARLATREHLAAVKAVLQSSASSEELPALGRKEILKFIDNHMALCQESS